MIYELLSMIPFVAIYALFGGPALTKSSWLGDRNHFIEPGLSPSEEWPALQVVMVGEVDKNYTAPKWVPMGTFFRFWVPKRSAFKVPIFSISG